MSETAPDKNPTPTGTEVMVPGYHRRLFRRYSRRHQTAAVQQPTISPESKPIFAAEAQPSTRGNVTFLKRMMQYLNMMARFKHSEQKREAGHVIAQTVVKKAVKKL